MRESTGLDFGTSTTSVARPSNLATSLVHIGRRTPWLPSVAANQAGSWVFGELADDHPQSIRSVKRFITFNQTRLPDGGGSVDDLIQGILTEAIARSATSGHDLRRHAVRMGCPAGWVGSQRQRLAGAAQGAGLEVHVDDIIDEPVAAGVAWIWEEYLDRGRRPRGKTLVLDYGGGTVDVALLEVEFPKDGPAITVLSARGYHGAGDALDEAIERFLEDEWSEAGIPSSVLGDPLTQSLIRREARRAKEDLSLVEQVHVRVDAQTGTLPPIAFERSSLEQIFGKQMDRALIEIEAALRDAHLRDGRMTVQGARSISTEELGSGVRHVLLAGGMSMVPYVRKRLQSMFPGAEVHAGRDVTDASTMVVKGLGTHRAWESINLHRPGLDFRLSLQDRTGSVRNLTLYEAFTPLYSPADVFAGYPLRYSKRVDPGSGGHCGQLSVRTVGGEAIQITIDQPGGTVTADHIEVPLADRNVELEIRPDGKVIYRAGAGRTVTFRVTSWPHVRFAGARMQRNGAITLNVQSDSVLRGSINSWGGSLDTWRHK